jgi:hypothetical protein
VSPCVVTIQEPWVETEGGQDHGIGNFSSQPHAEFFSPGFDVPYTSHDFVASGLMTVNQIFTPGSTQRNGHKYMIRGYCGSPGSPGACSDALLDAGTFYFTQGQTCTTSTEPTEWPTMNRGIFYSGQCVIQEFGADEPVLALYADPHQDPLHSDVLQIRDSTQDRDAALKLSINRDGDIRMFATDEFSRDQQRLSVRESLRINRPDGQISWGSVGTGLDVNFGRKAADVVGVVGEGDAFFLEPTDSPPSCGDNGIVYYDDSEDILKLCDGTNYIPADTLKREVFKDAASLESCLEDATIVDNYLTNWCVMRGDVVELTSTAVVNVPAGTNADMLLTLDCDGGTLVFNSATTDDVAVQFITTARDTAPALKTTMVVKDCWIKRTGAGLGQYALQVTQTTDVKNGSVELQGGGSEGFHGYFYKDVTTAPNAEGYFTRAQNGFHRLARGADAKGQTLPGAFLYYPKRSGNDDSGHTLISSGLWVRTKIQQRSPF